MTENSIPKKSGIPLWVKIVLIVSVAANLGVAGVIGGAALRAPETRRAHLEAPEGVAMLARSMPQAHQHELRETLRERRDDLRPNRQELKNLRDRFIVALRAEPFDINAVNLVFADQRRMLEVLTEAGHDAVIEQIGKMTPQDREQFIQRLRRSERQARDRQPTPQQ